MSRPGGNRQYGRDPQVPSYQPKQQALRAILEEGNAQLLVDEAEKLGRRLKDVKLKASQIRRIFGELKSIQADLRQAQELAKLTRRLTLLRPRLAYQAKRIEGMDELRNVLDECIQIIVNNRDKKRDAIANFVDFFEAILAYHKFHGGED